MRSRLKEFLHNHYSLWIIGLIAPALFALLSQYLCALMGESIIKKVTVEASYRMILFSCLFGVLGIIVAETCWGLTKYCLLHVESHVECSIKQKVFNKVIRMKYGKMNHLDSGKLFLSYNSDAQTTVLLLTEDLYSIMYSVVMGSGICIFIMTRNILMGVIILFLVISVLLFNLYYSNIFKKLEKEDHTGRELLTQQISQLIKGKDIIRILKLQETAEQETVNKLQNLYAVRAKINEKQLHKALHMDWFVYSCATLILPFACVLVSLDKIALSEVVFIIQLAGNVIWCTQNLGTTIIEYNKKKVSYDELNNLLTVAEEPSEISSSDELHSDKEDVLVLSDVSIDYEGYKPVEKLYLTCKKGTITAITGSSGAGKSSIFNAVLGFTDYDGSIKVWEQEVRKANIHFLRKQIAYMSENCEMSDATLGENIRLGNSSITDAVILHYINKLHLNDILYNTAISDEKETDTNQMPPEFWENLDIDCGFAGEKLSGGQRQRVAFIRTLVKNSDLILLDEPTSALDKDSENSVLQVLQELREQGKTIVIVSHSRQTIFIADQVIEIAHR